MAISLTESAANRVKTFLAARGAGIGLRLGVRKTGCSGFAYVINYADGPAPGDAVFEDHGVRVFVDCGEPEADRRHGRGLRETGAERGLPLQQPEREGRVRLRRELLRVRRSRSPGALSGPRVREKSLTKPTLPSLLTLPQALPQGKLRGWPLSGTQSRRANYPHRFSDFERLKRMALERTLSIVKPDGVSAQSHRRGLSPLREGRPVHHRARACGTCRSARPRASMPCTASVPSSRIWCAT